MKTLHSHQAIRDTLKQLTLVSAVVLAIFSVLLPASAAPSPYRSWAFTARTSSYAQASVGMDPAAAIAWAQSIPDEALCHQTLLKMAQNRAASSDTEALELLKAAGLTD